MGLIIKGEEYAILSDIQGLEDALGEMDFKVAGTKKGITAVQMDIKVTGITTDIMREAMDDAKKARFFIIDKLVEAIPAPNKELSPFAPRMIVIKINPAKIKDVIGPGGKMINKIIQETGIEKMDIEDDGTVYITALDGESGEKAKATVEALTKDIAVGEVFEGTVTRVIAIGAFVQILPGKEGLVHISQLDVDRVGKVEDVVNVGDKIKVKVMEVDGQGRLNLSRKALMPGGDTGGFSGGGGGDRGRGPRGGDGGGRERRPFTPNTGAPSAPAPREAAPDAAPSSDLSELPRRPRRRRHGGEE
jgi:polyribonucleotide nucleotidyltransferase